ncbi:MAG: type IV pilus secretin PilQ [Deltaproteobacteria bacterium]|nr:MAG: type IV pilus secretin PilQ [Deltaproteobacteria bacterium]
MKPRFYRYRLIFLFFSLMFIFAGCSSHDKKPGSFDKWKTLAKTSQPVSPVHKRDIGKLESTPLNNGLIKVTTTPSVPEILPEKEMQLPAMPVTIRMHTVSVPVVLRTLARIANINILLNDTISGMADIDVKNVPWDQAFLSLIDAYGLAYEWSGQILRVLTVKDLNIKKALLEARQDFEQSKKNHAVAMSKIKKKQELLEPLLTKIIKIHYADLKVLQSNLDLYLKGDKKKSEDENSTDETIALSGSILIDEFSNSLIIHATKSDIDKIMPIIYELDKPIKQVRIEAHIVEANSDAARELGIRWGGVGTSTNSNDRVTSIGGDMSAVSGTSLKNINGVDTAYDPLAGTIANLPIASTTGEGMVLGLLTEKIGSFRLFAQLSALESKGAINIISRPSITTMDNRKAIIKSGQDVPFQTITDGEVTIEFKEAVIKLEVVPHIINDNIIKLEIVTHKDELDWTHPVNGNPTVITKNAETMVTLFDGQTTVIGGLNKEKHTDGEAGVPGLKDIPGLSWLFKSTNKANEMEELLIFITPYILKEQNYSKKPVN